MNVKNLSLEEMMKLITGAGFWHTNDLGGKVPVLCMSDGPHGLRRQDEGIQACNNSYTATCFPTASASACSW
ncbi:MAG: hypothetical protein HUJ73_02845, partial [Eubacterium sp.]|nr:hypothetical protein [Eubacterium sp.]